MAPTCWGFSRQQCDPADRETTTSAAPPWAEAAAFDPDLGEAVDLTVANSARLAIYRILDRLIQDPFDTEAAWALMHAQNILSPEVKSAQARQANRTGTRDAAQADSSEGVK